MPGHLKTVLYIIAILAATLLLFALGVNGAARFFAGKYNTGHEPFDELKQQLNSKIESGISETELGTHTVEEWPSDRKRRFLQAPELEKRVEAGELPPVAERLPENPLVVVPPEQMGPYGGRLLRAGSGPSDIEAGVGYLMTEGLLKLSPDGESHLPNLAADFEILDGGRAFRFTLRKGLRWSDGHPFTTADIEFWHRHMLHNKTLTPAIPTHLRDVEGNDFTLDIQDEHSLVFRFPNPNPAFLLYLAGPHAWESYLKPSHYLESFHEEFAGAAELRARYEAEGSPDWSRLFLKASQFHMNPELPTMLPWKVTIPPPATLVRFERNPYYWKVDPEGRQLPYLDAFEVTVIDSGATELAAQYGKLDFQRRGLGNNVRVSLLRNAEDHGFSVRPSLDPGGTVSIAFNLNSTNPKMAELFAKPEFKQAMSMGFDRQALIEAFAHGRGMPFQSGYLPSSPYYREQDAKAYTEYAPERANELLDMLGMTKRDGAGFRTFPDGSPLVIYFEEPSIAMKGGQVSPLMMVCDYWRNQLDVNVVYKAQARGLYYTRDAAGLIDLNLMGGAYINADTMRLPFLAPTAARSRWCPQWCRWYNSNGVTGQEPPPLAKEMATLEREFAVEIDVDRKAQIAHRLLDINREHLWTIGMYLPESGGISVVSDRMRNVPYVVPNAKRLATEIWSKEE